MIIKKDADKKVEKAKESININLSIPKDFSLVTKKPTTNEWKVLLVGPPGSGKTFVAYQLVKAGYKLLIISYELGGSGTRTITNNLKRDGLLETHLKYIEEIVPENLEHFLAILTNLDKVRVTNGQLLWEWAPDVIFVEGFNYLQDEVIDSTLQVPAARSENNSGTVDRFRELGLKAEMGDWIPINRGTRNFAKAILNDIRNPLTGKKPDIVVTMYNKKEEKKDMKTGKRIELHNDVAIQGQMRQQIQGGFDVVIEPGKTVAGNVVKYWYKLWKERGVDVKDKTATLKADFGMILDFLKNDKSFDSIPRIEIEEEVMELEQSES